MERTIVTILSTNFAGSHYLSLVLGSHSHAMHIGEIHHLRRAHKKEYPCSVCADPKQCPLVRRVTPKTIDRVYDIIFENVEDPAITTLVDTSKKVAWASRFVGQPGYRMKYIHLIRDPRALVRRWMVTYETVPKKRRARWKTARHVPQRFFQILRGPEWRVYLYKWLWQNQEITHFLTRHALDAQVLSYREVALDTEASVTKIESWLGEDFEPKQLEYWNVAHHGTQKESYEWVKEEQTRYFDVRWQSFLSPELQTDILTHSGVATYLDALGFVPVADGLARKPVPAPAHPGE
jgi:hypothetical protein